MSIFEQIKLDDISAKGSYGIGLQIGQQLLESQMNVNVEAIAKVIYDSLNQQSQALDLNEVMQALQKLQREATESNKLNLNKLRKRGKHI